MRNDILEILSNDCRKTPAEIAVMLGVDENIIKEEVLNLEKDGVICGYPALVNWDNTPRDYVSAMIEVRVTPQRDMGFDHIAKRLYGFDEVKSVYLMSGAYDILVNVECKNIKEVSYFVSNKLSTLDSVLSTATHFVLKKYKDYGKIMEAENIQDERMIVSP